MRGKKYLVLVVSLIFLFGLTIAIVPVKSPVAKWVKIYVDQPLGYIPFQAPGTKFSFDIMIETHGIADGTIDGIVAWGMDIRVDPNILNVDLVAPPPPPFPPPPPPAGVIQGDFLPLYASWYGLSASLLPGTSDPTTGYWDEISESLMPTPTHGAGDYTSSTAPLLVTIEMTSRSDTQPCLIDLIDVEYRAADGLWYPVDVVIDGYYGTPPPTFLSVTPPFDPMNPIGSRWHELYPRYSNYLVLTSWVDNTDTILSASDQVDFLNETDGWTYWYHVDAVTVTIHWTFKPPDVGGGDSEPYEVHVVNRVDVLTDPIGTTWHQIYPEYSRPFKITSWEDTDASGTFNPSDQFDFEYLDEPEPRETRWAHLDKVTTDLILSFKYKEPPIPEFPLGLGIIMMLAPAIPIVYIWRRRKKEA